MTCLSGLKQISEYEEWSNILSEQSPVTKDNTRHFNNMSSMRIWCFLLISPMNPCFSKYFSPAQSSEKYFCIASDLKTENFVSYYGVDN
jgi:hypothetical protein